MVSGQTISDLPKLLYRYRAGFNHIAAMAIISRKGEILEINQKFSELFGYSREEVINQPVSLLRSPVTPESTHSGLWETVLSNKLWSSEIQNCRKDGQLITLRTTIAPAEDTPEDGGGGAFLVFYQDITEEVATRKVLEHRAREDAKQILIADTLHNIGNLQHTVMASNSTLSKTAETLVLACRMTNTHLTGLESNEERLSFATKAIALIEKESERLGAAAERSQSFLKKTSDVLDSFRAIQRYSRVVNVVTPLTVLREMVEMFAYQAATYNIRVSISHAAEGMGNLEVKWPMAQLNQILLNLMKNAAEAINGRKTTSPDLIGHIDLSVSAGLDGMVILNVADNGGGFDALPSDLFKQGYTTKEKGLGIGLHNAARLMQSMGGHLDAANDSLSGVRGALFKLHLPVEVSERIDDPVLQLVEPKDWLKRMPNLSRSERLKRLTDLITELASVSSAEINPNRIVTAAQEMTNADGVTIYLVSEDRRYLQFLISRTTSMDTVFVKKANTLDHPAFREIPLYSDDGKPSKSTVSAHVASQAETINVSNIQSKDDRFDFTGTRKRDADLGYKTQSLLTVPVLHGRSVVGVLQMVNSIDPVTGKVCDFSGEEQALVEALAINAAATIEHFRTRRM